MSAAPLVELRQAEGVSHLTLNRPERHNSLVPELLEALLAAVAVVRTDATTRAVVLGAAGRSFSTGGDLDAFQRQGEAVGPYAERLVGLLNDAILALLDLEVPLLGRVQGPVTGGALGLVLACDLVVLTPQVFFAPYYVEVGFAPDGGWTALLPERIGARRAAAIQLLNRHVGAEEALALGLADAVAAPEALDWQIAGWLETLRGKRAGSVRATKRLLLGAERRARCAAALEAERREFVARVGGAEARTGVAEFLGPRERPQERG